MPNKLRKRIRLREMVSKCALGGMLHKGTVHLEVADMAAGGFLIKFDGKKPQRCYSVAFDYDEWFYAINNWGRRSKCASPDRADAYPFRVCRV